MSGLIAVIYFLIMLFFSVILYVSWIRIALRFFKISALHPVSQVVNRFTDPYVKPIEQLLSSKKLSPRYFDWACFFLIIFLEIFKFIILGFLLYQTMMPVTFLILFVVTDLVVVPCNLLFYIILIRVIMSWVNPSWQNPVADAMKIITDPLLSFGHRLVPNISGFDFSPFVIMIILKVITLFMSASLPLKLV